MISQQDYRNKNMPVMGHNVVPVYKMGYTGKDITIMIVDDGIQEDHPDLQGNFVSNSCVNIQRDNSLHFFNLTILRYFVLFSISH